MVVLICPYQTVLSVREPCVLWVLEASFLSTLNGNGIPLLCDDLRGDKPTLADLSTHLRCLMLSPSSLPVQLLVQIPL